MNGERERPPGARLVQSRERNPLSFSVYDDGELPTMENLSAILSATLAIDAATRRNAERALLAVQAEPDFAHSVLQLAQSSTAAPALRQSATLAFKNWIKLNYAVRLALLCALYYTLLRKC